MNEILKQIEKIGIVPVVVLEDAKDAAPLAQALCDGGLPCAEVTFRTDAAEESIRIMVTLHSLCDLRALRLLEQLKGREAALEIVKDITFTEYPKNLDGILDMRDRVNAAIEASL